MEGLIVKTHNRFYEVRCGQDIWLCSPKGAFKRKDGPKQDPEYRLPVIGDRVEVLLDKGKEGVDGYITRIVPRRNRLIRADLEGRRQKVMAANLDRILVVSAVCKPGVDFALIDRYLLTCDLAQIPVCLVINKIELEPEFADQPQLELYRKLEIPVLLVSAKTGQGMDQLDRMIAEGISYLTGASGVGKSSMINHLAPHADLVTGAVDPKKGRGRHTTTFSMLIPIGECGNLVDSPGLRDFYPPKVEADQVRFGFREIAKAQSECRFATCLHDGEPGCAVVGAVRAGHITDERYKSYLFIMREMKSYFQNRY